MSESNKPAYDVFVVKDGDGEGEQGQQGQKAEKGFWTKVGAAWPMKSGRGGFNVELQATPINGRLKLLPFKPRPPEGEKNAQGKNDAGETGNDD